MTRTARVAPYAVLLAVGVVYLLASRGIPDSTMSADGVGPRSYPIVLGGILVVLAIIGMVSSVRGDEGGKPSQVDGDRADEPRPSMLGAMLLLSASLLAFIVVYEALGYFVTMTCFLFAAAMAYSWSERKDRTTMVRSAVLALTLTVLLFLVFDTGLGVPLAMAATGMDG